MTGKKKLKSILLASLTLAATFSLAACGKKSDNGTTTPTDPVVPGEVVGTKFTVTINIDGQTSTQEVNSGEIPTLTAPTKTGYKFVGWYTDAAFNTLYENTAITADTTLYAHFIEITPVADNTVTMNGQTYATIKAAIAAIPTSGDTNTYEIRLGKGTYTENGIAYNGSATIKISGYTDTQYGTDVIIKGRGSDMTTEKTRSLIAIQGTGNIILENLTLESDYSRADVTGDAQAEVLGTDTTGKTVAYNCSFISHQDTLRTAGKAWFYGCHIEGDVDFIWMEQAGTVALYEKCEIVSVYDEYAGSHKSYLTAPRMAISSKVGKGLVIYNSVVKESDEAKANDQKTYLARTPWSSGYFNQVAYINSTISDVELEATSGDSKSANAPWYGTQIATDYDKTVVGWKMDQASATSLGYAGNGDIVSNETVAKEFNGRNAILNRVYDLGKGKYQADTSVWDVNTLAITSGWVVDEDTSKSTLDGEEAGATTVYNFDGSQDVSAISNGFTRDGDKAHFKGAAGSTITIPVTGKCYVEVYGYYSGTVEAKADTQNEGVLFFNNGNTNAEIEQDYIVYDAAATNVVITAKAQTYITKIVVVNDNSITDKKVESIEVTRSTNQEVVGVPLVLTAKLSASDATNKSVKWTSSDDSIAVINEYTGAVTFKKAGEVSFTVTALDGSGLTETITCNPIDASWTTAEFYIKNNGAKDDSEIAGQESNNFTYGDINTNATATFTNLAGDTVTTNRTAKMNGAGYVSFATTDAAYVTIIMADKGKTVDAVLSVTGEGGQTAELVYQTGNSYYPTLVYKLSGGDSWTIKRGGSAELNVIAYVKVEYDAVWNFQTATPSTITTTAIEKTTGEVVSNIDKVKLTVDATDGKLAYNASGYAQFNAGTIIKVPVKNVGSVITVVAYSGQSKYTIGTGEGQVPADTSTDTDTYTVTAADVATGYVEIIATGGAYIYSISLSNPL